MRDMLYFLKKVFRLTQKDIIYNVRVVTPFSTSIRNKEIVGLSRFKFQSFLKQ